MAYNSKSKLMTALKVLGIVAAVIAVLALIPQTRPYVQEYWEKAKSFVLGLFGKKK